jgi:transcriptional regulator with XRE-family HTH domain
VARPEGAGPHRAPGPAPDSLGQRIRRARLQTGLTQAALGAALGHPQSVIARWERGALEPRVPDLLRLAPLLGVAAGGLLAAPSPAPRTRSGRSRDAGDARRLGLALRLARLECGLDPYGAGRRARIAPRRLRQIEQGADPSLDELQRLCGVVGFDLVEHAASTKLDAWGGLHKVQPDPPRRLATVPSPDRNREGKTET